jgi:hypothetical protein
MKIYRRYRLQHYEIPARDVRKGHRWYMVDMFHEQTYCSISHDRIKHGAQTKHLLYNGKLPCIQWRWVTGPDSVKGLHGNFLLAAFI